MGTEVLHQLEDALQAQYATVSEASDELRITDAAGLFAALGSSDMLTRLSVLEAVALDPQGALALGSHEARDLITVLCTELERALGTELRLYVIFALAAMPSDPRVIAALEQVWFLSDDTNERLSAISRLAQEANPAVHSHLEKTLLGDDPDRAQAVANVWRAQAEDSPELQLRLALAAEERDQAFPALDPESLELWLGELRGPFAERARERLEANVAHTVDIVSAVWNKLGRDTRAWLLELATRIQSGQLSQLTDLALRDESLQLEAIEAAQAPLIANQYARQLEELADGSPDPVVRAAAIQAGAPGDNRFRALRTGVRAVRIAATRRLGGDDLSTLLKLLYDGDWRIRSAAADRLAALGERGQRAVRPLLRHERLEVRMAAARVLQEQFATST